MGMSIAAHCKKHTSPLLLLTVIAVVLVFSFWYNSNGQISDEEPGNFIHPKRMFGDNGVVFSSNISKGSLPQDVINRVKKFVFFVGYPRSGHSIVGSFMDAHPHMVIAHEFMLFTHFSKLNKKKEISEIPLLQDKRVLFNALYHSSAQESKGSGWRSGKKDFKNYTLGVNSPWLGKYDKYISVIGDKSGGMTAIVYNRSPEKFTAHFKQLQKTVGIPIKVIHCVRNPYDMVSTNILYMMGHTLRDITGFVESFKSNMSKLNEEEFMEARFDNERLLRRGLDAIEGQAEAVTKIIELVGADNVLELHNSELVNRPKSLLRKLCTFLEVDCSDEYFQACSEKVYKSVSRSRDMVVWPDILQSRLEDLIETYPFFHGYTFSSE